MKVIFLRFLFLTILPFGSVLAADDFVPVDQENVLIGTSSQSFIIDSANEGGDIVLQFGDSLGEFLAWDSVNSRFQISADLDFSLGQLANARLENLAVAPVCDGGSVGRVYFDTVENSVFVCDGTVWEAVGSGGGGITGSQPLATARYRDSSTTNLNINATDNIVPWDLEDFEDDVFVHDTVTNNSRIQVTEDGKYLVSGSINLSNTGTNNFRYNGRVKFRVNGTIFLDPTFQPGYIRQTSGQDETSLVYSVVLDLQANDYFELLIDRENTVTGPATMIPNTSSLSLVQLAVSVGSGGVAPYLDDGEFVVPPSSTRILSLFGNNFSPTSTVSFPGFTGTINSTTVISPSQIDVDITSSATTGTYDIVVDSGGVDNTVWAGNGVGKFKVELVTGTGSAGTYTEGFEAGLGSWVNSGLGASWTRQSGGTPSNGTGPNSAATGSFYMFTETSNPNFPNVTFGIETTDFAAAQSVSFDYHMFGADIGTLEVQTLRSGVWTTRFSLTGQQQAAQGDAYLNQLVDLSSFDVEGIRFFYTSGSNFAGDAAIDNIVIVSN